MGRRSGCLNIYEGLKRNMEQNQPEQRYDAAKDFLQSLNQLEDMLLLEENQQQGMPELETGSVSNDIVATNLPAIDLEAFEEAITDIEQYFDKGSGE